MNNYTVQSYNPEDGSFKSKEEIDQEVAEIEAEIERIKNSRLRKTATAFAWILMSMIVIPVFFLLVITGKRVKMKW